MELKDCGNPQPNAIFFFEDDFSSVFIIVPEMSFFSLICNSLSLFPSVELCGLPHRKMDPKVKGCFPEAETVCPLNLEAFGPVAVLQETFQYFLGWWI